jgi:hypothetical protein
MPGLELYNDVELGSGASPPTMLYKDEGACRLDCSLYQPLRSTEW